MSMIALSSATMGMQSAGYIANRSAAAIANQSIASSADQMTASGSGQQTGISRLVSPTDDVAKSLVDQREALTLFKANAKVFKTADQMIGSLLDARA